MRAQRKVAGEVFNNPILIGTITLLVALVAVYLSYIAENGLPFVPTYDINVQVANAGELVKNADVRIGGARVGQVLTITPEPATRNWPHPYAKLGLALDKSLEPLPANTHYQVRLASVLGGKYLEIIPGTDKNAPQTPALPDGGTFTLDVPGQVQPQHPVRRPRYRVRHLRPEDPVRHPPCRRRARRRGRRPGNAVQRGDLQRCSC